MESSISSDWHDLEISSLKLPERTLVCENKVVVVATAAAAVESSELVVVGKQTAAAVVARVLVVAAASTAAAVAEDVAERAAVVENVRGAERLTRTTTVRLVDAPSSWSAVAWALSSEVISALQPLMMMPPWSLYLHQHCFWPTLACHQTR